MRTTNTKSRECVVQLKEFKASNLSGRKEIRYYVVYSYNWYPLFAYHYKSNKWFENEDRYSVSTSKQKGQCHPQVKTIKRSHEEMQILINQWGAK